MLGEAESKQTVSSNWREDPESPWPFQEKSRRTRQQPSTCPLATFRATFEPVSGLGPVPLLDLASDWQWMRVQCLAQGCESSTIGRNFCRNRGPVSQSLRQGSRQVPDLRNTDRRTPSTIQSRTWGQVDSKRSRRSSSSRWSGSLRTHRPARGMGSSPVVRAVPVKIRAL